MDRKDIALTVGGVLATMVLAWLLYRLQKRDQAEALAASTDQAAQDASATVAADPYSTNLTDEWLAQSLINSASTNQTGATSNTAASVSTSSPVADLGSYYDSTDVNNLLSEVVAAYSTPATAPANSTSSATSSDLPAISLATITPAQLAAMQIPTYTGTVQTATGNIPLTAEDATAQAMLAISPSLSTFQTDSATYLPSMVSSAAVSSHPVTAHPIVGTGS